MLKVRKSVSLVFLLLQLQCGSADVISDAILPFIAKPVNDLNKFLTQNPVVRRIGDITGDAIAVSGKALTDLPLTITRLLGSKAKLPSLLDERFEGSFQQKFLDQYNAGRANDDVQLHITELVTKYGYRIDPHTVETGDGYILTLYRIQTKESDGTRSVVLLMHGMLGSSDDWVIAGPDNGLAYILADRDYDVWLGNARGNKHSRRHATIPPSSSRFWDFSWHEIGTHDLPAIIDYILGATGRSSLKYVGHSQGTTVFFVLCAELPEYNEKVELMVALSPVAWMSNVVSPLVRLAAPAGDLFYFVLKNIGANEFLPNSAILKTFSQLLCAENALSQILCSNVVFLIGGFSIEQVNSTNLPVIFGHLPAGASSKQLLHYGQGVVSKDFRKFDFGEQKNLDTYGSAQPPNYRVDQITAPVSLVYSKKDWLASPADVEELRGRLKNVVDENLVPREQFNHLDFVWGVDANELIFKRMLKIMETF